MRKSIIIAVLVAALLAGIGCYLFVPHYKLEDDEKVKFTYKDVVEYATAIDPESKVNKESVLEGNKLVYEVWEVTSPNGTWHVAAKPQIAYGQSRMSKELLSKTVYSLIDDRQVVIIEKYMEKYPELGSISKSPIERYTNQVTAYTDEEDVEKVWTSYKKLCAELPEEVTVNLWIEMADGTTITPFVLPM